MDCIGIKVQGANFSTEADLVLFAGANGTNVKTALVFGRNGSGKSTIARAFRKTRGEEIKTIVTADMIDKDSNIVALTEAERQAIFVFDEDFIDKNIRIQEDGLGTIVMLGEQVEITKRIDEVKIRYDKCKTEIEKKQKVLNEFQGKTSKSPQYYMDKIKETLKADRGWAERERDIRGTKQNARVTDEIIRGIVAVKPEDSRDELLKRYDGQYHLLLDALGGEAIIRTEIPQLPLDYKNWNLESASKLLHKEIQHPNLTKREKYLLELLRTEGARTLEERIKWFSADDTLYCPYCLQDIEMEYKSNLVNKIKKILTDEVKIYQENLRKYVIDEKNLDLSDFSRLNNCSRCCELCEKINELIQKNNEILQQKLANPYRVVRQELVDIKNLVIELDSCLKVLQEEKDEFNQKIKSPDPIRRALVEINKNIGYHDIIDNFNQYKDRLEESDVAKRDYADAKNACQACESELTQLNMKRLNINIAIDVINNCLKYIFFHDNRLKLKGENDTYRLLSNGNSVAPKDVSVGERNIIALCYFFASILRQKSRDQAYREECLIVIDDPVSSYDLENKVGILSFLKYKLGMFLSGNPNTRTLVLTHDLLTFFDIQKIFKEFQDRWKLEGLTQSFRSYELNDGAIGDFQLNKRQEYTELLKIIYDYGSNSTGDYDIVIGNIMRQVLEAFSTFVYRTGIDKISTDRRILERIDAEYRGYFENLMYRLVLHGGSHREEQVKSLKIEFFSVISQQDKQRTARDIICFLYLLNKEHVLSHLGNVDTVLENWCEEIKLGGVM